MKQTILAAALLTSSLTAHSAILINHQTMPYVLQSNPPLVGRIELDQSIAPYSWPVQAIYVGANGQLSTTPLPTNLEGWHPVSQPVNPVNDMETLLHFERIVQTTNLEAVNFPGGMHAATACENIDILCSPVVNHWILRPVNNGTPLNDFTVINLPPVTQPPVTLPPVAVTPIAVDPGLTEPFVPLPPNQPLYVPPTGPVPEGEYVPVVRPPLGEGQVPVPGTLGLLVAGLAAIAFRRKLKI